MFGLRTPPTITIDAGTVVARKYRILGEIGRGGMAAVYLAEQIEIRKKVAIKVLYPEHAASKNAVERFLREARAVAAVRSPYIVDVHDAGYLDDGRPFIAMEWLEGESLHERLRRSGSLDIPTTVRCISHLSRALTKAHQAGIVHRDLKHENVFVTRGDDGEEVFKVVDFGFAKFYEPSADSSKAAVRLTQEGSVFGTPGFMAPEQVMGLTTVDHRADLWAVGCIAYECLVGRTVWPIDLGETALFAAILTNEPPVPSRSRADLPPAFDAWFKKCLAREPNDRFQSAKELADAFGAVWGRGPISSPSFAAGVAPGGSIEDRYRILGVLASGGMGTVSLAVPRAGGPHVAIKQMHRHLVDDRESVAMFVDEARIAYRLRHPNIVTVHEIDLASDDLMMVMEYVEGISLDRLIKEARKRSEPLPIPVVCRIAADALRGLAAAHSATNKAGALLDVVHRDISPQNLIVGTNGITKVADFGIASARGRLARSHADSIKGKVGYLAPEQFLNRETADRRVDLFSLAIVLWESLTTKRLFAGANNGAIVAALLRDPILPPSELRPDVPLELDDVVLHGLERDPTRRFATADEFAAALESLPLASASEVSQVVARLGKDQLESHDSLRRTEQDLAPPPHVVRPPAPVDIARNEPSIDGTTGRIVPPSPAVNATNAANVRMRSPRHRSTAIAVAAVTGIAIVLGVVLGLGVRSLRSRTKPVTTASVATTVVAAPVEPPPMAPVPVAAFEPSANAPAPAEPPAPVAEPPVVPPPAPKPASRPVIATEAKHRKDAGAPKSTVFVPDDL